MPDWLVEYKNDVRNLLLPIPETLTHRSIYLLLWPSFHGETSLLVAEVEGLTSLEFRALSASYWHYSQHKKRVASGQPKNEWSEPPEPRLLTESIELDETSAAAFWNAADERDIWGVADGNDFGIDGISVDVETSKGPSASDFHAWSPDLASPQGRCVDIVFQLAWNYVEENDSAKRLEEIFGYIYNTIPHRVFHGRPLTLKIFGCLSSAQEEKLVQTLDQFRDAPAVLVDMSNFEGMGTLLHPVFQTFAHGAGRKAWLVNDASREHLIAAGVPAETLFDAQKEASVWLEQ